MSQAQQNFDLWWQQAREQVLNPQYNYGVEILDRTQRIIIADQKENSLIPLKIEEGMKYIDLQLEKGSPIVVGVDDTLRVSAYNNHKATEHFIVIVGVGEENGRKFYRFFDVARKDSKNGTSEENKLYVVDNEEGKFLQAETYNSKKYTVTEIRKNKG